ncbi:MAG: helix-turn-helix domain-containing protein [Thermomicrobiales bacterium]
MSAVQVEVVPAVLVWARESMGLSREEAAPKLDLSPGALQFLEEGVGGLSMPKLRRMAEVYDRPLLAFFLPEPPEDRDSLPDYRLMPGNYGKPWTPELHEEFRRIVGQREVMLELAELEDEPLPGIELHLRIEDDPEKAGERVRHWLDVPTRFAAPESPYDIFNIAAHNRIYPRNVFVGLWEKVSDLVMKDAWWLPKKCSKSLNTKKTTSPRGRKNTNRCSPSLTIT